MSAPAGAWRGPVLLSLLAAALWGVSFAAPLWGFWVKISLSGATLAGLALILRPGLAAELRFDSRAFVLGAGSAAVLYGIFRVGREAALALFGFAPGELSGIHALGEGAPAFQIALILLFVTGPCEEIFWRGYLQRRLSDLLGEIRGWLAASAVYALVHVFAWNFMLVGAALAAGLFWGYLYRRLGSLAPILVSHALWSTVVFAVAPLR